MFPSFYQQIQEYCESHSSALNDELKKLERETHLKTLAPQMITGPIQALFLQILIRLAHVHSILEIGTFTGYGALAMAQVLPEEGRIDTIEINKEYAHFYSKYFPKHQDKINVIWGDALEILPSLKGPYDMIYIDAGKTHYEFYLDQAIRLSKSGSLILADNVLWSGKVLVDEKDEDTSALHQFNQKISNVPGIENHIIIPIRDGLHLMIRN